MERSPKAAPKESQPTSSKPKVILKAVPNMNCEVDLSTGQLYLSPAILKMLRDNQ